MIFKVIITVAPVVFASIFVSPSGVSAGIFSFVSNVFSGEKEQVSVPAENSQTINILEAPLNSEINNIGGGDILVEGNSLLAEASHTDSPEQSVRRPGSDQISIYVVREGDTLSQIADMFDVSVNTIKWGNDISDTSSISVGQTLVILPISGVKHTIEKGETLQSIAKKYKGDIEEIMQYNGIKEDTKLATGETIIIPDGDASLSSSKTVTPRSSSKNVAGYFIKPIRGVKTQGLHGHNAIDFGAPVGTPIVASASGTVIVSKSSGWNGGYGKYIVVRHSNGTQTLYAHNNENIVYVGDSVKQGQVIGYVGSTGRSTGPHVHFEVRGAANPF